MLLLDCRCESSVCVCARARVCVCVCMCVFSIQGVMLLYCRCEKALMSSVTVRNCIKFYQTAEEISAELLKQHCSQLISNHWVRAHAYR